MADGESETYVNSAQQLHVILADIETALVDDQKRCDRIDHEMQWYHAKMTRNEAEKMLKDGIFTFFYYIIKLKCVVLVYSIKRLNRISRGCPFYFGSEIVSV